MTDKTLTKKKIYQLAKEINISHETLIEYLKKRGHTVKGIMTVLDDAMMHDVLLHFKKDKEVADKHHKRIQTIRETRKRADEKLVPAEPPAGKPKVTKKTKVKEPADLVPAPMEIAAEKVSIVEAPALTVEETPASQDMPVEISTSAPAETVEVGREEPVIEDRVV